MCAVIGYAHTPPFDEFRTLVERLVVRERPRTVYDLGGGANPVLSRDFVASVGLTYILVDVSEAELALAPHGYEKAVLDLEAPISKSRLPCCDLAITSYVLEHIEAPQIFHRNVHTMLAPEGRAAHFFSTLYSLPFLVNRLVPHRTAATLAKFTLPQRETGGNQAVFPARYRWCRGPTQRQMRRFEGAGFELDEYRGYFGHSYFRRWPRVQGVEYAAARALVRHPVPMLTSFAYVSLIKRA